MADDKTSRSLQLAVKRHMKFRGLTNKALAAKAGIHPNTVSRITSDPTYEPSGETMQRVARALGLESPVEIWTDPWAIEIPNPLGFAKKQQEPDCIDIDDLPDALITKEGKPLTPSQKQTLKIFLDTLLGR